MHVQRWGKTWAAENKSHVHPIFFYFHSFHFLIGLFLGGIRQVSDLDLPVIRSYVWKERLGLEEPARDDNIK